MYWTSAKEIQVNLCNFSCAVYTGVQRIMKHVRKILKELKSRKVWKVCKFYQELLKENSNSRLKGNRKGIIVKGKEFYIPILNTFI